MKKSLTFTLLLICAHLASAQQESPSKLIKSWVQFWNNYDLNQVKKLFVSDSTVTYFSSERPGLIHGMDSLISHHKRFGFLPGGKKSDAILWLTDERYGENSVTATWHFKRTGAAEQRGPVTFILRKDPSGYRIKHAHFSNDPPGR